MADKIENNELQSKVIDFLRFPLIVGVVFIHTHSSKTLRGVEISQSSDLPVFYYCSQFFSEVIGRIAVPLFFFISGYLFFLNIKQMTGQIYKNKLLSRIKTLLIPYLFWNLSAIFFFFLMRKIGFFASLQQSIDFQYFTDCFFGKIDKQGIAFFPISYQFWFIRDLMIAVLLTPLVYWLVKNAKLFIIAILGICWFLNFWFKPEPIGVACLFFFTTGAYFGIHKLNLLDVFGKIKHLSFILFPIFALTDLLTEKFTYYPYIHNAEIITGIVFFFNLVAFLFEKSKIKQMPFLSSASFFVFAIHEPFLLMNIKHITYSIFKPENDLLIASLYLLNVIIVVSSALCIYWVLQKFVPKFTTIITGGR